MAHTKYIDVEQLGPGFLGAVGVSENRTSQQIIFAGITIVSTQVSEKNERVYKILSAEYGIDFIFEDEKPVFLFYPVPQLFIFAMDKPEGVFACTKNAPSFDEQDTPIYYINKEKQMFQLARNLRGFFQLIVGKADWKGTLTDEHLPPVNEDDEDYLIHLFHLDSQSSKEKIHIEQSKEVMFFSSLKDAKKNLEFLDIPSYEAEK